MQQRLVGTCVIIPAGCIWTAAFGKHEIECHAHADCARQYHFYRFTVTVPCVAIGFSWCMFEEGSCALCRGKNLGGRMCKVRCEVHAMEMVGSHAAICQWPVWSASRACAHMKVFGNVLHSITWRWLEECVGSCTCVASEWHVWLTVRLCFEVWMGETRCVGSK